jgi:DNA topoisomerase-3
LAEACPKCKKKEFIKGKSAYGCSDYKAGCTFYCLIPLQRKNIRKPVLAIASKGSTVNLKDFKPIQVVEGLLV